MRVLVSVCVVLCLTLSIFDDASARSKRRRRSRHATPSASEQTKEQVRALLGDYAWGSSSNKVMALLSSEIRAQYKDVLAEEKDPLEQDRKRKEMGAEIAKLRANKVSFSGKETPWDVSLIDKEFAHNNHESMLVRWGRRDRRFYFFHHDKLWKVYIAFNSDLYKDKTFADFAALMERRFGPAERVERTTLKGEQVLAYLRWPPVRGAVLRAIDNTEFYGNFCLVVTNQAARKRVVAGRKRLGKKESSGDSLLESVLRGDDEKRVDVNENVVDRITGRGIKTPKHEDIQSK